MLGQEKTVMGSFDIWSSATEQARALRGREISAIETLGIYRKRIERYDPRLNAVIVKCFDRAEQRAAEIDALSPSDVPRPLAGLPMTIKESVEVKGLPTTGGVIEERDRISPVDAPQFRALDLAGMTLMGKTNIPAHCADWQSNSPVYGRTNNPWNLERSPGGSSGGSAAAVAAAMTPLELGTDIGGSVRVPASFCGVYGLRPSETAMPRYGDFPGSIYPNPSVVMSTFGPIARDPEDLELALDILSHPDPGEDVAWRIEIPPARHARLDGFRVGMLGDIDWVPLASSVRTAQETVRRGLEVAGASVREVDPENLFGGSWQHYLSYSRLLLAIMGEGMEGDLLARFRELIADRAELLNAVDDAFSARPSAVFEWHGIRQMQLKRFRELFKDIDVLVSPIWPRTAYEHIAHTGWPMVEIYERTIDIDGTQYPQDLGLVYPSLSTFAGQPSVAFPVAFDNEGLPVGLQAIGPYLEDRTSIQFARLLAGEIGGFTPPPGFD
jgi:amidase